MSETLRGQVEAVRVIRDGWGTMTVLCGSAQERAAVTGHPLGIREGDTVEVEGEWTTHPRFGRQFKASRIETVAPSDARGAIEWIRSRLPGVGRRRATEMLERWPVPEIWEVLEERAHELACIDGITHQRALAIAEAYAKVAHEREVLVALRGWGLTDGQAARVVARWGAEAPAKLREDPYILADEVYGFGFKRADVVALRMGLAIDHPSRIRACLLYLLGEAENRGHCYVPAPKLVNMAAAHLNVASELVWRAGRDIVASGRMVQREVEGSKGARVYPAELAAAEASVAASVRRLVTGAIERRRAEVAERPPATSPRRSASSPVPEVPGELDALLEAI